MGNFRYLRGRLLAFDAEDTTVGTARDSFFFWHRDRVAQSEFDPYIIIICNYKKGETNLLRLHRKPDSPIKRKDKY